MTLAWTRAICFSAFTMVAVAFTVEHRPGGQVELQSSADVSTGTELEKRLAGCLATAMGAAMEEVLQKYKNGVIISAESIATKAQAVVRDALER